MLEVRRSARGPQILVSRTHKGFLKRLFELEVPEIHAGTVEIKAIAREAGSRSKVAVSSRQEGLDPVGATVGQRGARVQAVVAELAGEKIDVIPWNEDASVFVANALSPAQVLGVNIDEEHRIANVTVPERMLSLAIGREGQNARLAARLTGWRIDIRSDVAAAEAARPRRRPSTAPAAPTPRTTWPSTRQPSRPPRRPRRPSPRPPRPRRRPPAPRAAEAEAAEAAVAEVARRGRAGRARGGRGTGQAEADPQEGSTRRWRRRPGGGRSNPAIPPRRLPERSCVACRTARPKRELVRVVRAPDGTVAIDATGPRARPRRLPLPGRVLLGRRRPEAGPRARAARHPSRPTVGGRPRGGPDAARPPSNHPRRRPVAGLQPSTLTIKEERMARSRSGTRGRRGPRKPPRRTGAFTPGAVAVVDPRERGAIELPGTITVKELAELLAVSPADIIRELIKSGIFATINQLIDRDTASLVAEELGFEVAEVAAATAGRRRGGRQRAGPRGGQGGPVRGGGRRRTSSPAPRS